MLDDIKATAVISMPYDRVILADETVMPNSSRRMDYERWCFA